MSHMVEKMLFRNGTEVPWHGLATEVTDSVCYSIKDAMNESGTAFRVRLEQLQTSRTHQLIDSHFAVMRNDTDFCLGVVGSRFVPLQNVDAFERMFQPFLDAKEAIIETMGSLDEGRKVFGLCKINRDNSVIVKDDEVAKYILLAHGHDGSLSCHVGFTPVRVVCWNTLCMALSNRESKLLKLKHTKNAKQNLERVRDMMNLVNNQFEATAEQFRLLSRKEFDDESLRKYVKLILKPETEVEDDLEEKPEATRTINIIDEIVSLVHTGRGNDLPGVRHTWWGAYNGMTEWLNYQRGHTPESRLRSLWFGSSAKMNKKALSLALEMAV